MAFNMVPEIMITYTNDTVRALELYSSELCVIVDIVKEKHHEKTEENRIINLQLEQIYDVYSSIIILIKERMISSSNVLVRALFESYIQFLFIIEDKEKTLDKLIKYRYYINFKLAKDIEKKISVVNANEPINERLLSELEECKNKVSGSLERLLLSINDEEFKTRINNKSFLQNWYSLYAGKRMTIRDLSAQLYCYSSDKKNWSLFYDDLYPQLSMYVHGYKGYETTGQEVRKAELYISVVSLVGTACSIIFNDLFGWLRKIDYIDDTSFYQKINRVNLTLANKIIAAQR